MIALAVRWARLRRPVVDCVVIGLVVAMGVSSLVGSDATIAFWLLFAGLVLPLVWWRRFPEIVSAATFVMALASWAAGVDSAYVVVVLLVSVFSVVRQGRPRIAWIPPAAVCVTFLVSWLLGEGYPLADLVVVLSALGVSVLLATTLRARRAYLDQLADTARWLEQRRIQEARVAAAQQRARMAREVHDVVTHNVAVMTSLADAAGLAPGRAGDLVAEISGVGRRALAELQQLIDILRDGEHEVDLAAPGTIEGVERVEDLVRAVRSAGLRVSYETNGSHDLPATAGLAVYRIVQEALTNALKHAGPETAVELKITCSRESVDVLVHDQGSAMISEETSEDPEARTRQGRGIAGMAERVAALGGTLEAGPDPAGGWKVRARFRTDSALAGR